MNSFLRKHSAKLLSGVMVFSAITSAHAAAPDLLFSADQPHAATHATISRGHNLSQRISAPRAGAVKQAPQQSPASGRGITPARLMHHRIADEDVANALLWESFEECSALSDRLPEGWNRISEIQSTSPDMHWYAVDRALCDKSFYPLPPDGEMMMLMYYDVSHKDETLVSPSFTIPAEGGYNLSYYWYTVPIWLYTIDRFHVDYDKGVFTNREQVFDFEVLVRIPGGEWEKLHALSDQFADMEYGELCNVDYPALQRMELNLDKFAGKEIQLGFRYWGDDGNVLFLDAVRVDLPAPDAHYTPHFSRLFYGLSTDDLMQWLPATVEFVPVNCPVTWYNTSTYEPGARYSWIYENLNDMGIADMFAAATQDRLEVTYRPDYSSLSTLRNNFYYLPTLKAKGAKGGVASYSSPSTCLQAGGTPEFDFGTEELGYVKYTAFSFDVITEGLGQHVEECEELGFFEEPIFGYTPNHDAWWEHYSYPEGNPDNKYSYVDGFANLIIPHAEAPLVVNGVSAMAYGTIYPEAKFYCKIYALDADGSVDEYPVAQTSILGSDVIHVVSGLTREFLTLNFRFDKPIVLGADNGCTGYLVEISGYHDPKIEYFAPLQSVVPNAYEWCLGFYHHYWPNSTDLTNDMSYVAYFKNDSGADLYTAFAIGLDAHYPWLEIADGSSEIEIDGKGVALSRLFGYYDATQYEIEAPDWLDVSLSGRYKTDVEFKITRPADFDRGTSVKISAPGVSSRFNIIARASAGADDIVCDQVSAPVYNLQGILVRSSSDTSPLPTGTYISQGKKFVVK